jgi:hypothetical protein
MWPGLTPTSPVTVDRPVLATAVSPEAAKDAALPRSRSIAVATDVGIVVGVLVEVGVATGVAVCVGVAVEAGADVLVGVTVDVGLVCGVGVDPPAVAVGDGSSGSSMEVAVGGAVPVNVADGAVVAVAISVGVAVAVTCARTVPTSPTVSSRATNKESHDFNARL